MFKMSAFRFNTRTMQIAAPLPDQVSVHDCRVVMFVPCYQDTRTQFVDVLDRFCRLSPALPTTLCSPPDLRWGCLVAKAWQDDVRSLLCQQINRLMGSVRSALAHYAVETRFLLTSGEYQAEGLA